MSDTRPRHFTDWPVRGWPGLNGAIVTLLVFVAAFAVVGLTEFMWRALA